MLSPSPKPQITGHTPQNAGAGQRAARGEKARLPAAGDARRHAAVLSFSTSRPRQFGRVLMREKTASRLPLKNELINRVLERLRGEGLVTDAQAQARWRLCLDEALVNAIVHGNNGDPRRFVSLTLMRGKQRWAVLIEDEGHGFPESLLPKADSSRALYAESGRGVLLMRQYADAVRYYSGGSAIMLVRNVHRNASRKPPAEEAADAG